MTSTGTQHVYSPQEAGPPDGGRPEPTGDWVEIFGDTYYRISNVDRMPVFLMSIVSASDHWLFIASNGGLTAGRINADDALFPYETEDKVAAHRAINGSTTVLRLRRGGEIAVWEPFAETNARRFRVERNLYKNTSGSAVIFEEHNIEVGLRFRVIWRTGDRFGFVRTCTLENDGDTEREIEVLDGFQNLLPADATQALQSEMSSLLNAYKRSELFPESGVGVFSMSATLTDRAEPSESLMATVAWQTGFDDPVYLLSSRQLPAFIEGARVSGEEDICGRAGSYFVNSSLKLEPGEERRWDLVADVNQDGAAVADLCERVAIGKAELQNLLETDIAENAEALRRYVGSTDGLQTSAQRETTVHHFANVMFNIMRGGLFADGYGVSRDDVTDFVSVRNRPLLRSRQEWFDKLPETLGLPELYARARTEESADLMRLCYEYLPLTFSRRHGDPSRPWNRFSINVKRLDGSPRLDYQGNWRDIFQNWEPLMLSYPEASVGVIAKFLNATTIDGYNPYRVTRDGIEWEVPEPDNPWSNIGYWSDHQIIYLQKLLEITEEAWPGTFLALSADPIFSTANVPYRIKPYEDMLGDWFNTIEFDREKHREIEGALAEFGTDCRLHRYASGSVAHVTMTEKLLILLLAKLTNLVPDGGIWMNTQRPEWNDANNALVGKGMSVVTVAYLYRFLAFWSARLADTRVADVELNSIAISPSVSTLLGDVMTVLERFTPELKQGFDNRSRRRFMDQMGAVASDYRREVYANGLSASREEVPLSRIRELLERSAGYVSQTLRANRDADGLYHSYNILVLGDDAAEGEEAAVEPLYPMLEGQVAVLSSGLLSAEEAVELVDGLRHGPLYRADQHSYMLYPYRTLPGFLAKNTIPAEYAQDSRLMAALLANGDRRLVIEDATGTLHFGGNLNNARAVERVLTELSRESAYRELVATDRTAILDLYEQTFDHRSFTGRSGTFYAYEGLGSIYWHMVSKLLLAVQENYRWARDAGATPESVESLAAAYYDVRLGLGFNKSPAVYGAFPTDPYSHSPWRAGARQPGMTGQVKEEVLTRWGELGVEIRNGCLRFAPTLLCEEEFCAAPQTFSYLDSSMEWRELPLPGSSLAFTYCQTPVVYTLSGIPGITVEYRDGTTASSAGDGLDAATSRAVLGRNGSVRVLRIAIQRATCRSCHNSPSR